MFDFVQYVFESIPIQGRKIREERKEMYLDTVGT